MQSPHISSKPRASHDFNEDLKRKKRMERLSSGPAFTAHRMTSADKAREKNAALLSGLKAAKAKVEEAQKDFEKAVAAGNAAAAEDDVVKCYKISTQDALHAVNLWMTEVTLPDDLGDDVPETVRSVDEQLRKALTDGTPLVKEPTKLHPLCYLTHAQKSILVCAEIEKVEEANTCLKEFFTVAEQFTKNVNKIATDLKSYLKQKQKKADQAKLNLKKQTEKQQIEDAKAKARQNAAEIRTGAKAANAIFGVAAKKWASVNIRTDGQELQTCHLTEPWIMKKSKAVSTWRNAANISIKLAEFAGGYKRTQSFKTEGRAQATMDAKKGKEETQSMMDSLFSPNTLNISKVPRAQESLSNVWFWGYDPKLSGASLTPNGAGMMKVLVLGEVFVVAFKLQKVMEVMKSLSLPVTCESARNFLLAVSEEASFFDKLGGVCCTMQADDVFYLPQGWMLCERCDASMIVYGVRRSYLCPGDISKDAYACAIELMKSSGRDTSKMEEVLSCYDPQSENPEPQVAKPLGPSEPEKAVEAAPSAPKAEAAAQPQPAAPEAPPAKQLN